MLCCVVLCCVVLCCVVLCCVVLCCVVLCCVVLCCAVLCCAVLCCVVLCRAVLVLCLLCCAVLAVRCAVLCYSVLCCAVLCCVVALVVNFWDALERKHEMPVVLAVPEVLFRDPEGQVWDLFARLPSRLDRTVYEWDTRLAISGHWPAAGLLWPVCGRLMALLPHGQMLLPDWGGASGSTGVHGVQIVCFPKLLVAGQGVSAGRCGHD